MNPYVIIGNSIASIGVIEGIRKTDKDTPITIVSKELHPAYCRPLISYYLEGKAKLDNIGYRDSQFYQRNNVHVIYATATSIDPSTKIISLSDGNTIPYDKACICTGSSPFIPPFAGLENVKEKYSFMTLDDALALEQALSPSSRVLIVGAGLIGLKCAEGIVERVSSITVTDLADRVLSSILDHQCASMMQKTMEDHGIHFLLNNSVVSFEENLAHMKNGETISFDVLVLAVGVRANTSLIKDIGGSINRGIIIDDHMCTSIEDIYAAGDCSEGYDITFNNHRVLAIMPNAYLQGETAGMNMANNDKAFTNAIPMNAIGFWGTHALSAGTYVGDMIEQKEENALKRFYIKDGYLNGFILINNTERAGIYTSLIRDHIPLETIDFTMLTRLSTSYAFKEEVRRKKFGGLV